MQQLPSSFIFIPKLPQTAAALKKKNLLFSEYGQDVPCQRKARPFMGLSCLVKKNIIRIAIARLQLFLFIFS
jgi:hypothetical protein